MIEETKSGVFVVKWCKANRWHSVMSVWPLTYSWSSEDWVEPNLGRGQLQIKGNFIFCRFKWKAFPLSSLTIHWNEKWLSQIYLHHISQDLMTYVDILSLFFWVHNEHRLGYVIHILNSFTNTFTWRFRSRILVSLLKLVWLFPATLVFIHPHGYTTPWQFIL